VFAGRFTAFIDACALAGVLKRNLLCTLAEAGLFRIRWSAPVLDETERAIATILARKAVPDAAALAARHRQALEAAFEEALVTGFETLPGLESLPDPQDAHVVAAARQARADVLVTDNLKHFPPALMAALGLELRSTDAFLADTITLDPGRATAAIHRMRRRFRRPEITPSRLLHDMQASGLPETADLLRPQIESL
jgi:predicted nucleic acid-binding protein